MQAIKAGLIADTYLHATHVQQSKKSYKDQELTPEVVARIEQLADGTAISDIVLLTDAL